MMVILLPPCALAFAHWHIQEASLLHHLKLSGALTAHGQGRCAVAAADCTRCGCLVARSAAFALLAQQSWSLAAVIEAASGVE